MDQPCLLVFVFWFFEKWGPADSGVTAPPRASQYLEIVNKPLNAPQNGKPTNPEPPTTSIRLSHTGRLCPCSKHPRAPGTAHMPLSPLKLFQPANPNPAYPVLHLLSHGHPNTSSCPWVSRLPLLPEQLWCVQRGPLWHGVPLLLGSVRVTVLSVAVLS